MNPVPAPAADTLAALPDDPVVLKRMLAELLEALRKERHDREALQHRMDQLLRRLYGPRGERVDPNQPLLFASPTAETPAAVAGDNPTLVPEDAVATPRRGHGRQRLPGHLVREPRVYELTEAERRCPCCGDVRVVVGQQTCEQLDFVPASLRIIEHVKLTYACPRCERQRRQASAASAPAQAAAPAVLTPTETLVVVNAAPGSSADGAGVSSTLADVTPHNPDALPGAFFSLSLGGQPCSRHSFDDRITSAGSEPIHSARSLTP
jgi:transposase